MKKSLLSMVAAVCLLNSAPALSFELTPKAVNGQYDLLKPSKAHGKTVNSVMAEYASMNNKTYFVTAECKQCTPAIYSYLPEMSAKLKRPVFLNGMGMYAIANDANTFVIFFPQPFVEIGKAEITGFMYLNVYNKQGTKGMNLDQAKALVMGEFKRALGK